MTALIGKWHALGNSYLVVERGDAGPLTPERARALCDPRTGPGSDGVLEVVGVGETEVEVVIWNPDGSTAGMSGNGTRIAAAWLMERTGRDEALVRVGGRSLRARRSGDLIEQELGEALVGAPETLDVGGEPVELVPVDVGNPHAVVRLDGATRDDLLRLGPALERHSRFPERTNVQLATPDGPHGLRVLVWERGAGETSASGSSASAAAAAAVARGWCASPVTVRMPGGDLLVAVEDGRIRLTGPAEKLLEGRTGL